MDTIRAAFGWSSVKDDDGSDTSGGESSDACAIVTSTGLEELRKQFPNEGQEVLEGYLRMRKGDVGAASTQYKSTIAWKKQFRKPTIADAAPFMRSAPGAEGPDGCLIVLEDMKGDCARDKLGRPVIASIGMLHGTVEDMEKQLVYANDRAALYNKPGMLQCQSVVIEVAPRKGAGTSFRFPDKNVRKANMDLQRQHYPSGAIGTTSHFCGLPRGVTWAFKLCKPFMAKETYDNMKLKPNFNHLPKYLPPASILKAWGGELEFDIEAYIQWRAKEEGVVVDPVAVRTFGDAASVAGSAKETKEANPMESVTSAALKEQLDDEPTLGKMGVVQKKGSGVGLFASSKWKKKLLCVIGGGCMYFDDAQLSAKSTCSRFLDLVGAYAESVSDEKNPSDAPFAFRVVAPARTFIFACESQEELDAWLSVIAREIQVGTDNHAARTGGGGSGGAKTGEAADGAGAVAPKKVVAL